MVRSLLLTWVYVNDKLYIMVRPLRIEFDGELYHVTSRGNARELIFITDTNRVLFLDKKESVSIARIKTHLAFTVYCLRWSALLGLSFFCLLACIQRLAHVLQCSDPSMIGLSLSQALALLRDECLSLE